jgi:hypothetical protein
MLKFDVRNFWLIVGFLDNVREKDIENLRKLLPQLREACRSLKLAVSVLHIDDMATLFPVASGFAKAPSDEDRSLIAEEASRLADAIRRECKTKLFLAVTEEASIELFENPRPFDKAGEVGVNEQFPAAIYDIQEAANCLALSRPTACVCHLMRVLEVGLQTLASELRVPFADQREWQDAINAIEGKIKLYEKGSLQPLPPDWKKKKQLYADLATQFQHFKDAWRNYAMHARVFYDEAKADIIYRSVREFMRLMAKRLSSNV